MPRLLETVGVDSCKCAFDSCISVHVRCSELVQAILLKRMTLCTYNFYWQLIPLFHYMFNSIILVVIVLTIIFVVAMNVVMMIYSLSFIIIHLHRGDHSHQDYHQQSHRASSNVVILIIVIIVMTINRCRRDDHHHLSLSK